MGGQSGSSSSSEDAGVPILSPQPKQGCPVSKQQWTGKQLKGSGRMPIAPGKAVGQVNPSFGMSPQLKKPRGPVSCLLGNNCKATGQRQEATAGGVC